MCIIIVDPKGPSIFYLLLLAKFFVKNWKTLIYSVHIDLYAVFSWTL